jgi:hypothetical protein
VSAKKKKTKKKPDPDKPKMPGGITGKGFKPGAEWKGNPGGRPRKLVTLISEALLDQLAAIQPGSDETNASRMIRGMMEAAVILGDARQLSKELLLFMKEARDTTEGRPAQKLIVDGPTVTDPVGVLKELVADCAGRLPGILDD